MNEQNQSLLDEQLVYRLDRLDLIDGWWLWALLIGLLVALFWFVIRWYRRDVRELPQGLSTSIMMLRIFALVLLVFFFLQPERRNRQRVGRPSEAAVVVDTSQSMSLAVGDQNDAATRIDVAKQLLSQSPLLTQLAKDHRVVVYGVGTSDEPEELWTDGPRQAQEKGRAEAAAAPAKLGEATTTLKVMAWLGTIILIASCIALLLGGIESWRFGVLAAQHWVLSGSVLGLVGGLVVSIAATLGAGSPLASLWGFGSTAREVQPATQDNELNPPPSLDFADALAAAGAHSPLGDGLQWLQRRHDPATLAGVVLITDGQSNGGISLEAAGRQLGRQGVPVYPVGLGSSQPPANVRVVDLEVPPRVYPGDRFSIAATLQGTGLSSPEVEVQLLDGLDADPWQPLAVETRRVTLPTDGSPVELQFELEPETVGRRQIGLEVKPAQGEQNVEDNKLTTRYEVVTRKLRVMVLAGGPMREYQFVRNLLYRDREITVDVWLQSGQEGMSQEANQLLTEFPSTPEALFEYDVIVAFDPDWDQFNAAQIELLDRWVAEQAGGLIYVAGPVFTPRLVASRNEQKATVRSLLPVTLSGRSVSFEEGRYAGEEPWPLQWSDLGKRAEFLWPVDEAVASGDVWEQFSGFYGYFAVREPKPGATVYASYSDPTTAVDGQLPVMFASQFYGAGRSFFLGSGELWRLRSESDAYFDRIYTKLVRWAAEGRLLRDSNRGVLLVDPPRAVVGETITIRAVLLNDQFQPLDDPEVEAQIFEPGRAVRPLTLKKLEGQPRGGTYGGQFVARQGGQYEVRVELGDVTNRQVLRDGVQVRMPTLELERPRRNDQDLTAVATLTNGVYLPIETPSLNEAVQSTTAQLVKSLVPRPQETVLPGTPDRDFQRRRNGSVMWLVGGALILEWVLRRLNRLA